MVSRYRVQAVTVLRRAPILAAAALAGCLCGCDERASASTPDAAPPPAPTSSAAPAPKPSASATAGASSGELRVLKMVLTPGVKNKEPDGKLDAATAGQRVYAHLTVRNRTDGPRPIVLAFLVGDKERSKVDLNVAQSWSFRTWGYVTLKDGDSGELTVEVRDGSGDVMERVKVPIKPAGKK